MQVNKPGDLSRIGFTRSEGVPPVSQSQTPTDAVVPAEPVRRADEVQLSPEARAMVESQDSEVALNVELGADRVRELRDNIWSGVYLTFSHADHIARAIITRGDI